MLESAPTRTVTGGLSGGGSAPAAGAAGAARVGVAWAALGAAPVGAAAPGAANVACAGFDGAGTAAGAAGWHPARPSSRTIQDTKAVRRIGPIPVRSAACQIRWSDADPSGARPYYRPPAAACQQHHECPRRDGSRAPFAQGRRVSPDRAPRPPVSRQRGLGSPRLGGRFAARLLAVVASCQQ